ncbi:MAG: GlmU family protein [Bacteroidales bacterium]|nr:GlmU family protein [Bacteroidales bacterium]
MNFILFDDISWENLLPLTFTRPVCEIRTGILTIKEKWQYLLKDKITCLTQEYLRPKFKLKKENDNILINGSVIPNYNLLKEILSLETGLYLIKENFVIAARLNLKDIEEFAPEVIKNARVKECKSEFFKLSNLWDIFKNNGVEIENDFKLLTSGRRSARISDTNKITDKGNVFIEEDVLMECVTLNASKGSIYIGKNTEIMEGVLIRGPFALCDHSVIKMSAKIYGPTTIGPYSKVGGEINNSVILGYSNKAHDGFLGNSVIGEWCNLGAGTNNSNLKNTYGEVKIWNYHKEKFINTGLQFCGLFMGDHSKCGINTMFNTGTVVGVNTNIFGSGFLRNFIPSFSWGGKHGFKEYKLETAFEINRQVMTRRNLEFNSTEKDILTAIFNATKKYRNY